MMENSSQAISPFKFLDSYSKDDKDIFFGRNREISEIHTKLYQSRLLLVYGASGTGKSSIINCGLANQLQETDWLPVHVRRGGDISNSMVNQLLKETSYEPSQDEITNAANFNEQLHTIVSNVFLDHFKPVHLIFDQFEELFIFGFKEEWLKFIRAVRYLMDTDLDVHFIFVIRGEYLEFLSEFEEIIPEFFNNRVRIEKMTRSMARESISGPSKLFSIGLDENFEDNLLKKLSPDKTQIELTFLQVILDKLYRNARSRGDKNEPVSFTNGDIEEVGQIGDILAEFVDEQLFKMDDSKAALTVLKGFVSLEGTKTQRNPKDIFNYCQDIGNPLPLDTIEAIITSFVNKRILKEKDDNGRYELRHDSLAQKIFEKITNQEKELLEVRRFITYNYNEYQKRKSILNDDDLSYIAPYERLLNLDQEQKSFIELSKSRSSRRRKAQRTRNIIIAVISLLMITSVIGFYVSQQQRNRAEELAKLAEDESKKALVAQQSAEEMRTLAEQNEAIAIVNATKADFEADRAMEARDLAKAQEDEAIRQKNLAETQRSRAELARQAALTSEREAVSQRSIAEERRIEAEQLRLLALSRELALKSIYTVDNERRALLSMLAYDLNINYGGNTFSPNIYRSLYLTNIALRGTEFNAISLNDKEITGLVRFNEENIIATSDGYLYKQSGLEQEASIIEFLNSGLRISSLDHSNISNEIVIGSRNGEVLVINQNGNKKYQTTSLGNSPVVKILGTEEVKTVALQNGIIGRIDNTGAILNSINLGNRVNDLVTHSNQRIIVAVENGELIIIDNNLEVIDEVGTGSEIGLAQILPLVNTNDLLIARKNGEIIRFNLESYETTANLIGHTASITDMKLSESGKMLITSSFDRSVRLWNLANYRSQSILLSNHERWATAVEFEQGGNYAYSTSYGGKVRKYALNPSELNQGLCDLVKRNLTQDEWSEFVGEQITYKEICQ